MSKYRGRKQDSDDAIADAVAEVFQPPATAKNANTRRVPEETLDKPITTMKNVNIAKLATFLANEFNSKSFAPNKAGLTAALYDFIESSKPSKGEVVLVLGYSAKSNGIFGDTESIKEELASLNVGKLKVTTPNNNLAFGKGLVSPSKYIDQVRELLATLDVNVREVQRSAYEVEYEGGEKADDESVQPSTAKKAPTSSPKKDTPAKSNAPAKKAAALKPPPRPVAKKIAKKSKPQDE